MKITQSDISLAGCGTDKLTRLVGAQTTVAPLIYGDTAFVGTELAFGSPLCSWGLPREVKRAPGGTVSLLNKGKNSGKVPSNAVQAQPQDLGNERRLTAAMPAFTVSSGIKSLVNYAHLNSSHNFSVSYAISYRLHYITCIMTLTRSRLECRH
jgi:hypothetical protein